MWAWWVLPDSACSTLAVLARRQGRGTGAERNGAEGAPGGAGPATVAERRGTPVARQGGRGRSALQQGLPRASATGDLISVATGWGHARRWPPLPVSRPSRTASCAGRGVTFALRIPAKARLAAQAALGAGPLRLGAHQRDRGARELAGDAQDAHVAAARREKGPSVVSRYSPAVLGRLAAPGARRLLAVPPVRLLSSADARTRPVIPITATELPTHDTSPPACPQSAVVRNEASRRLKGLRRLGQERPEEVEDVRVDRVEVEVGVDSLAARPVG